MARKKNKKTKNEKKGGNNTATTTIAPPSNDIAPTIDSGDGEHLFVDPKLIRFQHSRIRPYFSGCGRSVSDTMEQIRNGDVSPNDLPTIQVIVGQQQQNNNNDDMPWYFSLNNRRLWIFKKCREEGLLQHPHVNRIKVRIKVPKSQTELQRYTVENCALEAKFIREKGGDGAGGGTKQQQPPSEKTNHKKLDQDMNTHFSMPHQEENIRKEISNLSIERANMGNSHDETNDDSSSSDDDDDDAYQNPFSLLM
mmetsp:Transcript_6810/g.10013  ORF Transcript_6810/g.10013 Transcript_6810/m.10013 type:complete len:252 (+) Transcript_6810:49-804(+)